MIRKQILKMKKAKRKLLSKMKYLNSLALKASANGWEDAALDVDIALYASFIACFQTEQ